jgi:hypothetical protein
MHNKTHIRLAGATVVLGIVGAIVASGIIGAQATPARPPAFPAGQHTFPVMGANGQLLRDSHNRVVYFTRPSDAALHYLMPGHPPTVVHPTIRTGPALAKTTHPTAAQIAALNARTQAANAAAATDPAN